MKNEITLKKIPVTAALLLLDTLIFLLEWKTGALWDADQMLRFGAMSPELVRDGEVWRLFTAMFLHFSGRHLLSNMLSLLAFGAVIEDALGHGRFALLYLAGGICAGLTSTAWHLFLCEDALCAGASGAIYALAGALLTLALFHETAAYGIDRRRVLPALVLMVLLTVEQSVDTAAHVGGLLAGFLLTFLPKLIRKIGTTKEL